MRTPTHTCTQIYIILPPKFDFYCCNFAQVLFMFESKEHKGGTVKQRFG